MNDEKQILITGGTGFIGSYLRNILLRQGHYLTIITRNPGKYEEEHAENQKFVSWSSNLVSFLEETDYVINLAGENLFGQRWTKEVKDKIYNSRINTTRKLVNSMKKCENPPSLFISGSAVGYYGDSGEKVLDEDSASGNDFLAKVCFDWEAEAEKAFSAGIRVAIPRIGIVLEEDGGVVEKMKLPFQFFAGGPLGDGRQYVPWVHMEDLCRAILYPIEINNFNGPYNACSANPVTMNELAKTMGKVMNRPSFFRVPEFILKTALGEAAEPILASLRVQPKRLQTSGFEFEFEELEEALADIL